MITKEIENQLIKESEIILKDNPLSITKSWLGTNLDDLSKEVLIAIIIRQRSENLKLNKRFSVYIKENLRNIDPLWIRALKRIFK